MSFAEQVHLDISGFAHNVVYYDLKLSQKMADHHHFSFVWQYTASPVIEPSAQAQAISDYHGNEVIFTFTGLNGVKLMAKGVINTLTSIDLHGCPAGLHVTGISHTIFLDDMKRSRTFMEQDLETIVKKVLAEGPTDFFNREAIIPTYDPNLDYMPQYNETNFKFLKRLAKRYGQWFYSDGMRMQFGQLKPSKIKLINGGSLHHFKIETSIFSHKESLGGYDYNSASQIKNSLLKTTTGSGDRFASIVGYRQGAVRQPDLEVGAFTAQAPDSSTLAEMVKLQTNGKDAKSVIYSGLSYLPLGIGQKFTIENKTVEHNLVVIEVTHNSEVHGNYSCYFRAIPSDVAAPHYTNVHAYAKAKSQSAKVIDNNDPEGMGRVKVEFNWAGGNMKSDWMRKLQPYAGDGRGFYMTPEIGDEVVVDFVGGSAERPYVVGSHYNGKGKPEFFDSRNMIKGWKLKFGQLFKFIEKVGIWLSDPSGNELHMDTENKNINLTSSGTITIKAKNIIFEATESIKSTAGENISNSADKDIIQTAGHDISLHANGNIAESGDKKTEIVEGKITVNSAEYTEMAEKISLNTTKENMTLKASKTIVVNSGEKSNFN